jgi:hypothetical protein
MITIISRSKLDQENSVIVLKKNFILKKLVPIYHEIKEGHQVANSQ